MLVISITNQKGGVGKTTTTYHLARAAARRNLSTLVIDLDPQGNLTDSLSEVDLDAGYAGMADVLSAASPITLDEVVVVTQSRLYSATGLAHLLRTVEAVRAYYNPRLAVAGVLVNQHKRRTLQGAHWMSELTRACEERGLRLFDPPIPDAVAVSDAAESGAGLDTWPGGAKLAALYDAHLDALLAAGGGEL